MQTRNSPPEEQTPPEPVVLPQGLPTGTEIQHVAFVTEVDAAQTTLVEFKEPRSCKAILVTGSAPQPPVQMTMLLVPASNHENAELIANVWNWVEPGVAPELRRAFLITFWGARVIWSPGRVALIASADRLEALRRAVVDFSFYDAEIRKIEAELAEAWPHLKADTPLAFRFDSQDLPRRDELAQRFQQVVDLQARVIRLDRAIHHPPIHPPTLASQLEERLKERAQLSDRIEFVDDQLELFEGVYELCGHRSSEFVHAQKEFFLEWIVIILLATETGALIVDLLAANWI